MLNVKSVKKDVFFKKNGAMRVFTNYDSIPICLICEQSVSAIKEYNIKRHYDTKYGKIYNKFVGKQRDEKFEELKKNHLHQTKLFDSIRRENIDSVKCSYVISEKIALKKIEKNPFVIVSLLKSVLLVRRK